MTFNGDSEVSVRKRRTPDTNDNCVEIQNAFKRVQIQPNEQPPSPDSSQRVPSLPPTPPPTPLVYQPEACNYADMNTLLRSLHFERMQRHT